MVQMIRCVVYGQTGGCGCPPRGQRKSKSSLNAHVPNETKVHIMVFRLIILLVHDPVSYDINQKKRRKNKSQYIYTLTHKSDVT